MIFRPITSVVLALSFLWVATAAANATAINCDAALVGSKPSAGFFSDQHAKVLTTSRHLYKIYGQLPYQDLSRLTAKQRYDILDIGSRNLSEVRATLENWYRYMHENPKNVVLYTQISARLSELEQITETIRSQSRRARLSHEQAMSYLEVVIAVAEYVDEINGWRDPLLRYQKPIAWPLNLDFVLSLNIPQRPYAGGGLFIPTDLPLTIFDFNYLVGTGLNPVGVTARRIWADGRSMSPASLTGHDRGHGALMPPLLTTNALAKWRSLLTWANQDDDQPSSLRHAILFYLAHERLFFREFFERQNSLKSVQELLKDLNANTVQDLSLRLRRENYWDLPDLAPLENLEPTIATAMISLRDKLIALTEPTR